MNEHQILDIDSFKEEDYTMQVELVNTNKFIILCFTTVGIYQIWWTYKMWRFFKAKDELDIMPAMRTLFDIFFLYGLLEKIKKFAQRNNAPVNYDSIHLFIGIIVLGFISNAHYLGILATIIVILLYCLPVRTFNQAIRNAPHIKGIENRQFNKRQIVLLIIGCLLWGFSLFEMFFPEKSIDFPF